MQLDEPNLGIGAKVKHPTYGEGVVIGMNTSTLRIFFKSEEERDISRSFEGLKVISSPQNYDSSLDLRSVEKMLRSVLLDFSDISRKVTMGSKWEGGTLVLKPKNPDLQSKEVPIDTFFHKIVMVRDRLRVLEQNINSQEKLNEADKIHLQQYITRAYGSLTTFNVLFADKSDHFSSK